MSDETTNASGTGTFDVRRPGKSTPSASGKPIIITNRPVLKDPMMLDDTSANDTKSATAALTTKLPTGELKLEPLTHEKAEAKELTKPHDEAKNSTKHEVEEDTIAAVTEADKTEIPATKQAIELNDQAIDGDAPKKTAKLSDEAKLKKETEREAEIQKLIDARTYYLPINQVEKRRNKRMAILGVFVIILLSLGWADISLDSGIINIPGIKAPTHFFSNS